MDKIEFYKMSGSGNDFVIVDNRENVMPSMGMSHFASSVCCRKMSVGADGLILIEKSDSADFKWRFYNSDGSDAEMCGNGARCAARFAFMNDIAGHEMSFNTAAGIVTARLSGEQVKIGMTDPGEVMVDEIVPLPSGDCSLSRVNTGVPHVVIPVENLDEVDVVTSGRMVRNADHFAPAGTNVNFISLVEKNRVGIRTYERGVEDETLACGTGSVAGAIVASIKFGSVSPVQMVTKSGGVLTIHFSESDGKFKDVFLEGDARLIYIGSLCQDAWNYEL
jgi:diaminopimelate epimerase